MIKISPQGNKVWSLMLQVNQVFWSDVRKVMENINPEFFNLVDKLSPGHQFPMYLVNYGYGDLVGDDNGIFLPTKTGQYVRLDSEYTPRSVLNELSYGLKDSPLGMFFNKSFEWFLNTSDEQINKTFPLYLDSPGTFFSIGHIINYGYKATHLPNGILFVTAGSKSNFMIPKIGCGIMHSRIQKSFKMTKPAPRSYHEHGDVFREIVKNRSNKKAWEGAVLYFSENWVEKISKDSAWQEVRDYFYRISNHRSEYSVNSDYYNHVYRVLNKRNNLKSNLLIYETARYLFEILLGEKLGFAPAVDDEVLPLTFIQEVYSECYKLEYLPIVAIPAYYQHASPKPVYYSLQYPSLCSYSPKARNASTTLSDLVVLIDVINKYQKDFSLPIRECKNTILEEVSRTVQFDFYHSAIQEDSIIKSPENIPLQDRRFGGEKKFPVNAAFFKGCISISPNPI
ncbi:TPA: hypothetical protein JAN72_11920 [Legionella pneumophila]|nr:hypothetical protein [Legionella pneumophila]